jgi:hypothetical protein
MTSAAASLVFNYKSRTASIVHREGGIAWGWVTEDVPRMHIDALGPDQPRWRIWLESVPGGHRAFSLESPVPGDVLEPIVTWLDNESHQQVPNNEQPLA